MEYECKENDCLIEMGKDKSEILIYVKGETAKTVIGLKDLKQALILFSVSDCNMQDFMEHYQNSKHTFTDKAIDVLKSYKR
jgi:hypothetical protein